MNESANSTTYNYKLYTKVAFTGAMFVPIAAPAIIVRKKYCFFKYELNVFINKISIKTVINMFIMVLFPVLICV